MSSPNHSSDVVSVSVPDDSRRLLALFQLPGEAVALAAPAPWRLVYSNSVLGTWLDQPVGGSRDMPMDAILRTAPADRLTEEMERVSRGESAGISLPATLLRGPSSEREVPVVIRLAPVDLGEQKCVGLVMHRDQEPCESANLASRRDPLTGLADRLQLLSRMHALMAGDRSNDQRFAVLFIDLDDFKQVNDIHGHMVGDRVLAEVAERLARCIRAGDQIVRYGGDEFVVLVEQVVGWEEFEPVISRIHVALAEPILVPTGQLRLSVSVGAAEISEEHRIPEDLLAAADRAMYATKRRVAAATYST